MMQRLAWTVLLSVMGLPFVMGLPAGAQSPDVAPPTDNPAAACGLPWTGEAQWATVVDIRNCPGDSWDARVEAGLRMLDAQGGGVLYFPAGSYAFRETIRLHDHIILRGESPTGIKDARDAGYRLPTRFDFPQYHPTFTGNGTPNDTAFKGIELTEQNRTTGCGVVNIDLSHGHIKFGADVYQAEEFQRGFATYGRNHIVYGCILRNAAIPDPKVPTPVQHPWQRWTHRHNAAIDIRAAANVLVANNRIPESGEDDFTMKDYLLYKGTDNKEITSREITFHYDNRPGIYVNYGTVQGTPETHPWCFAKGITIRNNYVFCYGCLAIGFSGDGTYAGFNVVRYRPNAFLPIYTGVNESHHVNNNRAVEMRGWRWTVEGNDYEVYSNIFDERGTRYNDGEGLMHEGFGNCGIVDSKLINNTGNRYLCLWRSPVDGLLVQGNHVRTTGGQPAVCVLSTGQADRFTCRNVRILDNITEGTGILVIGKDCEGNVVKGNRHIGASAVLDNKGRALVEDNSGYEVRNE